MLSLLLLCLISSVNASKEAEWLIDEGDEGVFNTIRDTAWSILALNSERGYEDEVLNGSRYLITQLESCMVSNSCDNEDAAIALWALDEVGGNAIIVEDLSSWLLNSRSMIFTGDLIRPGQNEWLVQIVSDVGGICELTNTETGEDEEVSVNIREGYVPWHTISDTVLTSTTESLNLDCSSLESSNLILSLINKKTIDDIENYFIKQEEHGKSQITVDFGNPCWGNNYRDDTCNMETTAYVLYALDKVGKSGDPTWLEERENLGVLEKGFLYKITDNNDYLQDIISEKNEIGYWGSANLRLTAIIYTLLKPNPIVNGVDNWISSRRENQGCWPKPVCNVESTALVLYSGAFTVSTEGCDDLDGDGICDSDDRDVDGDGLLNDLDNFLRNPDANNNGVLDGDDDLDGDGVPNKEDRDIDGDGVDNEYDRDPFDDSVGERDTDVGPDDGGDTTDRGNPCTTWEGCEGEYDAIGQCIDIPGDGCPTSDTDEGGRPPDDNGGYIPPDRDGREEEDEGSLLVLFLWFIFLLLVVAGGGFLAYKKGLLKLSFLKKKHKPQAKYKPRMGPPKQAYVPRMASRAARKVPKVAKNIEKELDKSMEDLERLLGKK